MIIIFVDEVDFNDNVIALAITSKSNTYPAVDIEFRKFRLTYP